ncbi:MAG: sodium/proline symporter [Bacteroidota bacterium]
MVTKLIILSLYFIVLFLIGILASKKVKNISDYYVGGKKVGYWAAAFSARATGESGWLLLGLTGMGAIAGVSAYWIVIGEVLGVTISWFYMAKPFKRLTDTYEAITIPDYLESRFRPQSNLLRGIAATALSVFVIIYVSAQIDTTGKAFESLIGINYYTGAIVGFIIVATYIFFGGFLAAVWSDFFQGLMMFFGLLLLPLVAWFSLDNRSTLITGLEAIDPKLLNVWGTSDDLWINVFTLLGFAMIGLGFLGSPQIYVRFMSIKDENEINKGRWVAIIFTLLTDAAAVTIGLLGRYLFTATGQDPEAILGIGGEHVLIVMVEQLLPLTLVGVYVAIVLSAIMSTIDSLLIVASSAITRDFYQKIFNPKIEDYKLGKLSRIVTLMMALFALGLSLTVAILSPDRTIFWFVIFGWSGIAATFCPVIILSLFWKAYSEKGAIASMITGFLCVPFFKFVIQNIDGVGIYFEKLDVLAPSFLLAMIAGWIFTKLYPTPVATPKNKPS